jgi:hypothetical protein
LELSGTHQLLVYADNINILGKNLNIIKKNKQALLQVSREVDIKVNTGKNKNMVMSRHQNIGQNHNLPIAKVL